MYDLHTHSYYSDGTSSPEDLVRRASEAGLRLLGLTDHDTTAGIREALHEARYRRVPFLCGTEVEAAYGAKLHILGLGIDPYCHELHEMLEVQAGRRAERNERILDKLEADGIEVRKNYREGVGITTRTHIAAALVAGGYAHSSGDAFVRFIGRNSPYYVHCEHPTMQQTVECIREAGGVAVLAHPHKMRCDHRELVKSLKECGLWGIEVYYPGTTSENVEYFKGLARRYGLMITCGSDYHGRYRPEAALGCAWRNIPELEDTYDALRGYAI